MKTQEYRFDVEISLLMSGDGASDAICLGEAEKAFRETISDIQESYGAHCGKHKAVKVSDTNLEEDV